MGIHLNESVPVIYSGKVMENLQEVMVYGHVARKDFEGELNKGDRIIIRGYGDPTVGTYTGAAISWETIDDTAIQLDITERKYTAVKIDDVDKFQSDIEYMNRMSKRSAYKLAQLVDTTLAGLYGESSSAAVKTDATVDTATIISDITAFHTAMAEANVPDSEMWCIVPFWAIDYLRMAGIRHADDLDDKAKNSFVGRVLGVDLYASNNVSGTKGSNEYPMAGSYDAIALVEQIKESDFFEKFEDTFGSGMRTLHVWGYKVVKPKELFYADWTYNAETNI